jgi:hypothetical protein
MRGTDAPRRGVLPLVSLKSPSDLKHFVVGSDTDIGGASSAKLLLDEEGKGVFKGSLRATVMTSRNVLGGYAAFRSRVSRRSFLGNFTRLAADKHHRTNQPYSDLCYGTSTFTTTLAYDVESPAHHRRVNHSL